MGLHRGQSVICVRCPDYLRGQLTLNKPYVVNGLELHNDQEYVVVLGDDDRKGVFISTMFEPLHKR